MRGFNTVCLLGHLGRDPEVRTTPTGHTVCNLNLATNRRFKKAEEWVEETDWHRVTLWDGQAEVAARFLRKGDPVAIEGGLRTDSWTTDAGDKRYKTYVLGNRLHLVGGSRRPESQPLSHPQIAVVPVTPDEIPF